MRRQFNNFISKESWWSNEDVSQENDKNKDEV